MHVKITGAKEAADHLSMRFAKLRERIKREIWALTLEAQAKVKQKLSGSVLHVRTGVLRNSIASEIVVTDDSVVGSVGTRIKYGRIHEYGFRGIVTIGQHVRRSKAQIDKATYSYTNKFGRSVTKVRQTGKLGKSTGVILVRQHQRMANFPERSFLRSTLREMASSARQRMMSAVKEK